MKKRMNTLNGFKSSYICTIDENDIGASKNLKLKVRRAITMYKKNITKK